MDKIAATIEPVTPLQHGLAFTEAQQIVQRTVIRHVGEATIARLKHTDEGQPDGQASPTFQHMLGVGALLLLGVDGTSGRVQTELMLTGGLHDIAKLTDSEINELTQNGRTLTPLECAVVRMHAPLGGLALLRLLNKRLDPDSLIHISSAVAQHHSSHRGEPLTVLLQLADQAHAMLVDPHRTYRVQRMTAESLLDEHSQPNVDAIRQVLLKGKPETAYGARLSHLVDVAIGLMPVQQAVS